MKYGFHPEAKTELIESVRYYESHQPGLGRRFLEAVVESARRILAHPNMYRVVSAPWRQCRVPRFPFGIIFRINNRRMEIVAVMHLHRKPGYWQHRAAEG